MQLGTYIFEVEITDSNGATATSRVVVLVRPAAFPPIANPGNDRTVNVGNVLTLDGSASVSPDGNIVQYEWKQIDTNTPVAIIHDNLSNPQATVTGLVADNMYIFQLTVTDNQGLTGTANVRIIVTTPTTLNNIEDMSAMIYPIPFSEKLFISVPVAGIYERARIYSVSGHVVIDEDIRNQSTIRLDTNLLEKGYYILRLYSSKGESKSYKVVK